LRGFFKRRVPRVVGVAVLVAVVTAVLFMLLNWYVAPTKPSGRKDLILTLAQILGGAALLFGLYFTWRTLQVNREGQITERYTRAIDQLGASEGDDKRLEIRIGGIFALERLANESREDYRAIMEVLTAYVRGHAPRKRQEVLSEQVVLGKFPSTPLPSADIQAILIVIGRRVRTDEIEQQEILDLHETDLHGAVISGEQLGERNVANLRRCALVGADIRGAHLYAADLSSAYLTDAFLSGAFLSGANLSGAYLISADLYGANLSGANLSGANLSGADLSGADLSGADLTGAERVTNEELERQAASLEGATMPNGQKYEDWLKSKEGGG
jgi:uncharacterized protein YjbI with pentapeptide repeats